MTAVGAELSRSEWAPELPACWEVTRLRWVSRIFAGGTPDRKNTSFWTDGTVPWLNSGTVNQVSIDSPSEYISPDALAAGATRWAPQRSVVVALAGQGKTKGMSARLEIDSTLNQSLAAIVPSPRLDYRFLHFWLTANYQNLRGLAGGDLRDGLNLQHIGSIQVPLPSIQTQRAIADYLDRETAPIDAFIAKNEELIELIAERRAVVIESTIRDTSAPWANLGILLRSLKDGTHGSFERIDGVAGHPLLGARNIQNSRVVLDGNESMISVSDHHAIVANGFPRRGDVMLVIVGATIGKSAVYERDEPLAFQRSVAFLRPGPLLDPHYLHYVARTREFQDEIWLRAKVSAQPGVYLNDVANIPVPVPPLESQRELSARLTRAIARSEVAIGAAREASGLARERRAALISAAVTGKIDVGVAA